MVVIINFHSLILYKKRNSKKEHVTGEVKASLIFLNIYYIFGLVSVFSGNNIFT